MLFIRSITFCIFIMSACSSLHAAEYIGFGIHGGLQYDVGNLSGYPQIDFEGQHNAIAGMMMKLDRDPVFFRTGVDRSIMASKGEILNSSAGKLTKLKIQYTSIPMHVGLNFRIRDRGKFYTGFGLSYILGSGKVETTAEKVKIKDNIFGIGFITGVQLRAGNYARVYAEWEYISGRTDPVINISTATTQKDFSIDFTGHRIHLGVSYYIL